MELIRQQQGISSCLKYFYTPLLRPLSKMSEQPKKKSPSLCELGSWLLMLGWARMPGALLITTALLLHIPNPKQMANLSAAEPWGAQENLLINLLLFFFMLL